MQICLNELGTFGKRKGDVIFLQPTTRDGGEIPQLKELREVFLFLFHSSHTVFGLTMICTVLIIPTPPCRHS